MLRNTIDVAHRCRRGAKSIVITAIASLLPRYLVSPLRLRNDEDYLVFFLGNIFKGLSSSLVQYVKIPIESYFQCNGCVLL